MNSDILHINENSSTLGKLEGASGGIYIHIPFCKRACYYCDFHFSTSLKKKDELINSLVKELELRKDEFANTKVATIYFGGGTPSLLAIEELRLLIQTVYKYYTVVKNPEITLEANPDDLVSVRAESRTIFEDYLQLGINRLSIGIQSFYDKDLKLMNRAHSAQEAKDTLNEISQYFDNVSIDLIYGIPNTTNEEWIENIETALSYNITHISSYALTVEPKTALESFIKKGIIDNVDDEAAQQQFNILCQKLNEAGFVHYELSNFGKPDYFSKNNSAYWKGKHYLGIGPSAHSFNGFQRSWNIANNTKYIKALEENTLPNEIETLTKTDRYNEYVMTGLRTIWGVSLDKVSNDFGENYKNYLLKQAQKFIDEGLLECHTERSRSVLKTTQKGKFLCDGIASELFMLNLS